MSLLDLPDNIILQIALELPVRSIVQLIATHSYLKTVIDGTPSTNGKRQYGIWKDLFLRYYDYPRLYLSRLSKSGLRSRVDTAKATWEYGKYKPNKYGHPFTQILEMMAESFSQKPESRSTDFRRKVDYRSKNLERIREMVVRFKLIDNINPLDLTCTDFSASRDLVQIMLAPWIFCREGVIKRHWSDSQKACYTNLNVNSIFADPNHSKINTSTVLHIINFFSYYIGQIFEPPTTFRVPFDKLVSDGDKPQMWNSPLKNQLISVEGIWNGLSATSENIEAIRTQNSHEGYHGDLISHVNPGLFETTELHVLDAGICKQYGQKPEELICSKTIERELQGVPDMWLVNLLRQFNEDGTQIRSTDALSTRKEVDMDPDLKTSRHSSNHVSSDPLVVKPTICLQERARNFRDYYAVHGTGLDGSGMKCFVFGYVHLLSPQHTNEIPIPGFQRISLIRYIPSEQDPRDWDNAALCDNPFYTYELTDLAAFDSEFWVYEGIVTPGGKMAIGKWHLAYMYNDGDSVPAHVMNQERWDEVGPFVMWNTKQDQYPDSTKFESPAKESYGMISKNDEESKSLKEDVKIFGEEIAMEMWKRQMRIKDQSLKRRHEVELQTRQAGKKQCVINITAGSKVFVSGSGDFAAGQKGKERSLACKG
ncbi:hypothetical protein MMC25_001821 [Agyrium rufum]|nr:hypothetical protein [Agyrium rufum]